MDSWQLLRKDSKMEAVHLNQKQRHPGTEGSSRAVWLSVGPPAPIFRRVTPDSECGYMESTGTIRQYSDPVATRVEP